MDDHMYDQMLNYAECELIPRFQKEYENAQFLGKKMTECDSYEEMKALCVALNAVAPYAGYEKVSPRSFVEV